MPKATYSNRCMQLENMDYITEIETSVDVETCFYTIATKVDKWWGKVDNPISKIGDEFSIFFGKTEWRFKVVEYAPFEKITWKCIKAHHVHEGFDNVVEKWLHSELRWSIFIANGKTNITLFHSGLTSDLICYDVCKAGWDFFISTSLKNYLEKGEGNPYLK